MIEPAVIRTNLIERLAVIFGRPHSPDGLAEVLAKDAPAYADEKSFSDLADRVISTRKTKGFPSASELIAAVKAIPPTAADLGQREPDGTIRFDGAAPVTWVPADDPRFDELCAMERAADAKREHVGATTSKHAPGRGWYFPSAHVEALPLTETERQALRASRDPRGVVGRTAENMRAFQRQLRASAEDLKPPPVSIGEGPFARQLRASIAAEKEQTA